MILADGRPRHARTGRAAAQRPPAGTTSSDRGPWPTSTTASASQRLAEAVRDAGWLELRHDGGDGAPLASGVEAAIIADALGEAVADVSFAGPVLAADLARRAGASPIDGAVVAFSPDLIDAAVVSGPATTTPIHAVDCAAGARPQPTSWFPKAGATASRSVPLDGASDGADLTRAIRSLPAGAACSRFPTSLGSSRARISTPGPPWASPSPAPI